MRRHAGGTAWLCPRCCEPVTLPAKFPLLLAQGGEGIAVGLSSKILPHNFNEILDAAIDYIEGREFNLYPDFPTGGLIDVSRYNDGRRGGADARGWTPWLRCCSPPCGFLSARVRRL